MEVSIKDIIQYLNPISSQISNDNLILDVRSIEDKDFSQSSLGWCSLKNLQFLLNINLGTVIISSELANEYLTVKSSFPFNAIIVENPRKSFAEILRFYFVEKQEFLGIHPSVSIHPTVEYDEKQVTFEPRYLIIELLYSTLN